MRSFHSFLGLVFVLMLVAFWALPACGSGANGPCGDKMFCAETDSAPADDGGSGDEVDPFGHDANVEAAPPCVGIACNVVNCGNGAHTSISGTVYDPAGINPLYNVFVYVPNADVQPIPSGPVCTACQAPATGSPIVGVQTDAKGNFKLDDVPVGAGVPLVMQIGKWRRKISIPQVDQCVNTALGKKVNGLETITRMPKKQKEGDPADNIPLIALTTGCDQAECFMVHLGLDSSAISGAPANWNSADPLKRVHIYRGKDNGQALPGTPGDAYSLWGNKATMMKYDIIFNACECSTFQRDTAGPAYTNMKAYLEAGGRMFGTHYHYNWFAGASQCPFDTTCQGPADFQSVAQWQQSDFNFANPPYYIDSDFPKGKAFSDWSDNVETKLMISHTKGQLALGDTRNDVKNVTLTPNASKATRWIYTGTQGNAYKTTQTQYDTYYLSFNAPVNTTVDKQCGRAVFSDVHLSGSYQNGAWPDYCGKSADQTHLVNEVALEFLFFDLSSCVGDDSLPPPPPPVN